VSRFRTETIGDATLILGDCLEILADLAVDHVISDPPYEDELHNAMGRIRRTDGQEMATDLGFVGVNARRPQIAEAVVRASAGWVILFTLAEGVRAWRDDLQAAGAKWDTTLAWIKPDASPRFNGQGAARGFENAITCWAGTGYRRWNGGGKRGIYTHRVNTGRQGEHPTEKPLPLMREIVADFTLPGQTILDPFMGSGTTGVACAMLGRAFVGIEQDGRWFDLACRRIEEAHRQPRLFAEPAPRIEQTAFAFEGTGLTDAASLDATRVMNTTTTPD
jgi:site-specific DNA-methyltransferase (adenine-specific)